MKTSGDRTRNREGGCMQSIVCSGAHASSLKRPTVKRSGNLHFILQTDFGTDDIGSTRSQPECQMFGGTRCWKATFVLAWSWFCRREGYWFERSDCLNVSSENVEVCFYWKVILPGVGSSCPPMNDKTLWIIIKSLRLTHTHTYIYICNFCFMTGLKKSGMIKWQIYIDIYMQLLLYNYFKEEWHDQVAVITDDLCSNKTLTFTITHQSEV